MKLFRKTVYSFQFYFELFVEGYLKKQIDIGLFQCDNAVIWN